MVSKFRDSTLSCCWESDHWLSGLNGAFQHGHADHVLRIVTLISVGYRQNSDHSMPVQALRCCRSFGTLLCLVVEYRFIVWVDLIAHFNMGMPFEFFPVFLQFPLDLARTCTTSCQYIHWGAIEVSGLDSIWLLSISPLNEWTERRTSTLSFPLSFAQSFFNFGRI